MYSIIIYRGIDRLEYSEVEYLTCAAEGMKVWIVGEEKVTYIPLMNGDKINLRWQDEIKK